MEQPSQILVVEDEGPIRVVWERFLNRWGYTVDLAENGQIGLDKARAQPFQLIITDLTMPVMSGQQLVHTLKGEQPDTEIIVTTGQGTIEIAVEMMKAGAYDFVTKPINFSSAEFIVKKCLEKVLAREENKRLRELNRDLEELNKVKEKFIAITSHELRTPVSIIGNVLDVLDPALNGSDEAPLLKMAKNASEQLREIVMEMHELSKLNSAQIVLQLAPFPLQGVIDEVTSEFTMITRERGHHLSVDVSGLVNMVADRTKIKKVLRELLQNAIKFTPDGGKIAVSARAEGGTLTLEVTDNGIGVPTDEAEKIFQPFYEVNDSLHHHTSESAFKGGGMGIGLAIVKDIVDAHGGAVRVESAGQGSRFVVTLPTEPQAARA